MLFLIVIGRGGEQISQIQSQTNCRVQMSPESDGNNMRQCTLQGSKMSVDRARAMINEVDSCLVMFLFLLRFILVVGNVFS